MTRRSREHIPFEVTPAKVSVAPGKKTDGMLDHIGWYQKRDKRLLKLLVGLEGITDLGHGQLVRSERIALIRAELAKKPPKHKQPIGW